MKKQIFTKSTKKQVKLLKTQKHPKGDILAGTVYTWNEKTYRYEYVSKGTIVSTINGAGVEQMPDLFEKLEK